MELNSVFTHQMRRPREGMKFCVKEMELSAGHPTVFIMLVVGLQQLLVNI
jgi:hypothetical protein